MPNLKPPVTTTDEALDYRQVIALIFAQVTARNMSICTAMVPVDLHVSDSC